MAKLTNAQRARRYLQASMNAGYTGLPAEHREAYEAQMRSHEQAYPNVLEHALAGADQDFDKPLQAGEREHQRHLLDKHGLSHAQVLEARRKLRAGPAKKPSSPRARARSTVGKARGQLAAGAGAGSGAIAAAQTGRGSLVLQLIGFTLLLSLIYLLVAGKGAAALGGISTAIVGAVRTFVSPADPITSLESALRAGPIGATSSGAAAPGSLATPAPPGQGATAAGSLTAGASSPFAPAPPPGKDGANAVSPKTAAWGLPASLLRQDLALRTSAAKRFKAGTETVKQARAAEEHLVPRGKYPAFYANSYR